jgi:hypothetical protein
MLGVCNIKYSSAVVFGAWVFATVCYFHPSLIFAGTIRVHFVEHAGWTYAAQQIVNRFVTMTVIDLVTLKAAAKHELLFMQLSLGAQYKSPPVLLKNIKLGLKWQTLTNTPAYHPQFYLVLWYKN